MKIKAKDLTGEALDWAVAKCWEPGGDEVRWLKSLKEGRAPFFSLKWQFGGALFEECLDQGMLIERVDPCYDGKMPKFKATSDRWETLYRGDTPLLAACRAFVAKHLGEEIEVPEEVLVLSAGLE